MSSQPQQPPITPLDRLGLTLCLAIITHAIIVLGVTFASEDPPAPRYDTMEIILVQQKSERQDDAELLAQANLEGGGDASEKVRPATPLPPPFPDNRAELAVPEPATPPEAQPKPEPAKEAKKETEKPQADNRQVVAMKTEQAETPISDRNKDKPEPNKKVEDKQQQQQKQTEKPSAAQLLTNSFKVASLSAQVKRRLEARANRPRRKFISASTQEFKYASYMEAWRAKVERVGNLNYPDEARRRNLSGDLILDVALNKDGSINDIIVRRSSGYKILDDAAIRIVELAAPYSPFPEAIREETDILHITRTWQFLNNRGFR
ncbi:MAG: energy transducer TonB [Gammaproteobacteria bacterium]